MVKAASYRDAAKERRERLQRGEEVRGGLGKPMTWEDAERICREAGLSASDIQRSIDISKLSEVEFDAMTEQILEATERAEKAAIRRVLRRHSPTSDIS
jgi:hypothetical protein